MIVYSLINFLFLFGTTDWALINLLIINNPQTPQNKLLLIVSLFFLFTGFALKLGVAPFFVYKLEIYRGLPLLALFFYSIFYFISFVLVFYIVFGHYFFIATSIFKPLLYLASAVLFILFAFFLITSTLLKQFFALSSLINSVSLVIALLQ